MENKKSFGLSGCILKIFGLIFMTIDHVGVFLGMYDDVSDTMWILRILGRIALPIFIFLIVEGVIHTHNFKKYILRLAGLEALILVAQIIIDNFIMAGAGEIQSPIVDLVMVALTIYLLKRKDAWSILAILPIGYNIASFYLLTPGVSSNVPRYLLTSYPVFSVLLGIGFYYSKSLAKLFLKSNDGTKDLVETNYAQYASNIISALMLIVICFLFYAMSKFNFIPNPYINIQVYALFASLFILVYSGKRGYNAKWFQYGSYLYFPLHLVIIFLIFVLL